MSIASQEYLKGLSKYPHTKEIAGPFYWGTMHNIASKLKSHRNELLSPDEVRRFHQYLMYTSKHFVCDSCQDVMPWLQSNEVLGNTRQDMERYVCRMHNFVNKKTNKLEVDCSSIFAEDECPTCKFQSLNDTVDYVPEEIGGFNDARRKIFEALCKRDGLPVPEIRFNKCPESPHRSCVVPADPVDKSIVYLDSDPLRSINHEYIHYKKMFQGEQPPHNEYDIDMEAQKMIPVAMHDTEREMPAPQIPSISDDRVQSMYKRFPLYAKRVRMAHSTPAPELREPSEREARGGGGGFLSGLDGIFKPIGDMVGVPAHTANTMHMSSTIGAVINMITETATSPFGASVVSLFGSLILFGIGAFSKSDIGQEDRKILYGITSALFNKNISLLGNASTRESIMQASSQAGYALSRLDFDSFLKTLTQDSVTSAPGTSTGVIPPEQYRGYGKAPGSPAPSTSSGGILGGAMPMGGGISQRFSPEAILRSQQQETFGRAIEGRRPITHGGYTPPLDTTTPYDIPELGQQQQIPELDMNIAGGGIDGAYPLEDRPPTRKQTTVYPFEEDYNDF